MKGRLGFLIGFGAGYVLGAKAGTDRYDQLRRLYENLVASQGFRRASGKVKDAAGTGFGQAKEKAGEGLSKVQDAVRDKRTGDGHSGLSVAPPPPQ